MVGYSADDYLRFSADKETIYYSEPVVFRQIEVDVFGT